MVILYVNGKPKLLANLKLSALFALINRWRMVNWKMLWRAAHLCGQLPVLFTNETSSNIVDTFVPCDPNMYSHLCTEIYLSLFTALD